jgi:hypothetical protein
MGVVWDTGGLIRVRSHKCTLAAFIRRVFRTNMYLLCRLSVILFSFVEYGTRFMLLLFALYLFSFFVCVLLSIIYVCSVFCFVRYVFLYCFVYYFSCCI